MDKLLIEKVTRLIVDQLIEKKTAQSITDSRNEKEINELERKNISELKENSSIETEFVSDELIEIRKKTPARVGVGRSGPRPLTNSWLKFRYDHAAAVDAVSGEVPDTFLERLQLFSVTTKAVDKDTYIRRPDYGRRLSEEGKELIKSRCIKKPQVQIIISDGLSSNAILENVEDVYLSLQQSLVNKGIMIGTPFFIKRGRVAVMDDVGEILEPEVVVLLIGERPGLVSAESLSAYLCYKPRIGTIEADRMVVSNIHKGGIPPVEAGAYLGTLIEKILNYKASGISLVQKEL
ncbi:ethanolamine ammonia-lyase subunit EutC [Calidifontibacillus erzurumensis]|uniref:Ethanolamine ammonia-lyase small subunit n=1 Tax=Calidifontibacillus erzurumensis TaxID=2741433 RepID=A0A8J8KDT4_9BACI|nr:ethanolamine ammonia-lyase subunit EutC [Calidifontibacillus erzurumensis]NSL51040.1 ethanolamine ammonia-lyase subunit EutC [Calidifontibacillus erzurumensis]